MKSAHDDPALAHLDPSTKDLMDAIAANPDAFRDGPPSAAERTFDGAVSVIGWLASVIEFVVKYVVIGALIGLGFLWATR